MADPLRAAQAAGEVRPGVNPTLLISTLFSSITALILIAKQAPSDRHLQQVVDLLIQGCETPS